MAKIELDDDGLPKAGTRNPEGMFNARFQEDVWDMIRQLEALWEAEKKVRLNNKDVVVACIVRTYKSTLKNLDVPQVNNLPDVPLTPIEELEDRIKAQHAKNPKKRKR